MGDLLQKKIIGVVSHCHLSDRLIREIKQIATVK